MKLSANGGFLFCNSLKRMLYRQCGLLNYTSKPLLLPCLLSFDLPRILCGKLRIKGFDFAPDGLLQILSNGLVLTSGTVTLDLGVRVVKYESQSVSFCCSPSAPPPTMGEQWLLKQFCLNHPVEHIQKPKLPKLYVRVETSTSYFIIHNQFVK